MRKSIDGLSQLVAPLLAGDAFSGSVFVFMSRRREKVKLCKCLQIPVLPHVR